MRLSRSLVAVTLAAAVFSPASVHAQSDADAAARRQLLEQAQEARASGDHTRALDLASRAGRIAMTASIRRFVAEEQSALNHPAAALGAAELCIAEVGREPPSRNRDAVQAGCRTLAEHLRSRVSHLIVHVPVPQPHGLRVSVSGNDVNDAFWNVDYLVDPGALVIEANAPDYDPFHREVSVAAGASVTVDLAMAYHPWPTASASPSPSSAPQLPAATPASTGPATVRVAIIPPAGEHPSDVTVTFDGVPVHGEPPTVENVEPGEHVLAITAAGYRTIHRDVTVEAGQRRIVAVDLVQMPTVGTVRVIVPTTAANIAIDGQPAGHPPLTRENVTPGPHIVTVSAPGFQTVTRDVRVTAGDTVEVDIASLTPVDVASASHAPSSGPPAAQGPRPTEPHQVGPLILTLGAAAIVGGVVLWAIDYGSYTALRSNCTHELPTSVCPATAQMMAAQINQLDTISYIAMGAGGAIAIAGIVATILWRVPAEAPHYSVIVDPRGFVGLAGRF